MATQRLQPTTPRLQVQMQEQPIQEQLNESEEREEEAEENSEKTWNNLVTLETFSDWISVAAYKIECLDLAIKIYRWRLQTCILLGLLLSTASGTISVTQFGSYSPNLKFGLNLVLTITSFAVALLTGIVKTFKLQENLEEYIGLKQNWVSFSAKINNEIYLPKKMRGNAETLIKDNKARFLDLLKIDVPIPKEMSVLAAKHLDKGDDIESQYYKYKENIMQNEKNMNHNYMRCLSFFFNCCSCFYKPTTIKRITDNRELEKTIKYSKIENSEKYKRRAYQYTLSSIMLNNVKNECIEVRLQQHQLTNESHKEAPLEDTDMSPKEDRSKIASVVTSMVASVAATTNATVAKVKEVRKKKDSQKDLVTEEADKTTQGRETTETREEKENV